MNTDVRVKDIQCAVEALAPLHLAESWDNPGLQIGDCEEKVSGILTTLDVTPEAVQAAIKAKANMIVSHHPLFFKGLKHIDYSTTKGRMIADLIMHGIAVYSAHTNLDVARGGLNDLAAAKIGLMDVKGLSKTGQDVMYKIVCFVPTTHVEEVRLAMGDAGAGYIGGYSHCTFGANGVGTFKPHAGTSPFIGRINEMTAVEEVRLETIAPQNCLQEIIAAMKAAHPYEEVAYDVYELVEPTTVHSIGRIGTLADTLSWDDFASLIKIAFARSQPRFGGARKETVSRVALCTGSGAEFIGAAASAGADVYITGDVKYHDMQLAKEMGITVIDAGHFGTEEGAAALLAAQININLAEAEKSVPVTVFNGQKDFFF